MTSSFENFSQELGRLVEIFGRNLAHYKGGQYDEASLRQEFLNPFFRALGWDTENSAGAIPTHREVEIESRTTIGGQKKRADYLFRTDKIDRFICEAKKPAEELRRYAFQAKRYTWNKNVYLGVLSDFEEIHLYIVGSKPRADEPEVGLWKTWHFQQYPLVAREIWDLLSRDAIAAGSIDRAIESLPKKAPSKGKARQGWLIKPDRSRALDSEFLNFLDDARRELAQDLLKHNDRADLLEENRLNEAVQRILDRLLFLRICEDRDIDTGIPLALILRTWRERSAHPVPRKVQEAGLWAQDDGGRFVATDPRPPAWPLWNDVVAHFKALDRRPPSHIPFFNGNLFKEHFSETLKVGDTWLAGFLDDVSDEESPYLFNIIPVEILGTIYERFLGKIVRPHGKGAVIEEKPEVRKAGGVYYTPRYIVDYIVEQTVGKLLEGKTPEKSLELKVLDPACGSGSFLIRAYERLCEHWQQDLMAHPSKRRRQLCWVDEATGDLHLTTDLKRRILTNNIYGVDLDPGAVEVSQLSLYLKMLENENRQTLAAERDLFGSDIALLPPLQDNIKCGNSLIASDFSLVPEDLVRVRAFDWDVGFEKIMKAGGFDAVIGNPPYGLVGSDHSLEQTYYTSGRFKLTAYKINLYLLFVERGLSLLSPEKGVLGYIIPKSLVFNSYFEETRRLLLRTYCLPLVIEIRDRVFVDAEVGDSLLFFARNQRPVTSDKLHYRAVANIWPNETMLECSEGDQLELAECRGAYFKGLAFRIPATKSVLADCCKVSNGLNPGNVRHILLSDSKKTQKHQRMLVGRDLQRYANYWSGTWVNYDSTLKDRLKPSDTKSKKGMTAQKKVDFALRSPEIYEPNKVLVRKTADRIVACYDSDGFFFDSLSYGIQPINQRFCPKFVLGLLNSRLMDRIHAEFSQNREKVFAKVLAENLNKLPMPDINPESYSDRARHDKLVELVDKMLALTPRLRAAKSEKDKTVLQNAVEATDRQIDALVYELYGLTPEEIALVEGEKT